jgi:hypothetical protein
MSMSNSFIFFGCWNNINCDKEAIYRDVVLNCIKHFEPEINNMFIAGDNWYNTLIKNKENKDDSYKYYLVDTLVSGYHILYSMNKNIYICVGNHDEAVGDKSETPDCMIKTQKHYINKLKKYIEEKTRDFENVNSASPEESKLLLGTSSDYSEKTIKTFLDKPLPFIEELEANDELTNPSDNVLKLYADKDIGLCEDASTSYIVIIINTNILSPSYLTEVNNKIKEAKMKKGNINKLIFVMGHIPLFYDKHKKDKAAKSAKAAKGKEEKEEKEGKEGKEGKEEKEDITKLKKGVFGESSVLIDELYDILAEHSCIYLCADCHNFNIMKIKKGDKCVIQITSGTGGADPDIIKDLKEKKEVQLSGYDISYYSINSYGYCKITVEPCSGGKSSSGSGSVTVSYNKIIAADSDNKSIDELYIYDIRNNEIKYRDTTLTIEEKEKIKKGILAKAKNNKEFYCGRVAQYNNAENKEEREKNVIKSKNAEKTVCYIKKGK